MSEDLTLYRGESGQVYAVGFRCRHRGTQLSPGWVEGEQIRCRYHGWKYDGTGQCVEQPAERAPFCERVRIQGYPAGEKYGLIFIYMGEEEPPELPYLPELEREGQLIAHIGYRQCNFFNNMENSADEVHVAFTHRSSFYNSDYLDEIPEVSGKETEYGIIRYGKHPDGKTRICHLHMPNLHHIGDSPEDQSYHWRVPVDDETHAIPTVLLRRAGARSPGRDGEHVDPWEQSLAVAAVGDQVLAGKLHLDDLTDGRNLIVTQDYVTQIGQGRIADRDNEMLGSSDAVIVLLRTLWSRELRALAEGRPLKQWRHPGVLIESMSGE